jgi:hypothetical protein
MMPLPHPETYEKRETTDYTDYTDFFYPDFDTLRVKTPDNKGFSFFSRHYINNVWSKQRFCFENRINLPGILSNF